ncbi:MAG: DUF4397 domain-containing protein [Ferruginibacter sp.]
MKKIIFFLIAISAIAFSCTKQQVPDYKAPFSYAATGSIAYIKINYLSAYRSNPSVQLKVNDSRVSNLITFRTPFPGGGFNTGGGSTADYLAVKTGDNTVAVTIPQKNTNTDSVVIFTTNTGYLIGGKSYTLHITDTGANTKTVVFEDDRTGVDTSIVKYTFANLMPNVPFLDLYYGTVKVASNIPYLNTSASFVIRPEGGTLAWAIREAGASPTSTALATYSSASSITKGRSYTVFASGYKGLGSTDVRRPFVSLFFKR